MNLFHDSVPVFFNGFENFAATSAQDQRQSNKEDHCRELSKLYIFFSFGGGIFLFFIANNSRI